MIFWDCYILKAQEKKEPLPVRIGKLGFGARIKGNLRVEFGDEQLTSYAGLEMFRRYIRSCSTYTRLMSWQARSGIGGDVKISSIVLLLVSLLLCGGRRLRHVRRLENDPMVARFAGLRRLPSDRTLSRQLAKFRMREFVELDELIVGVAADAVKPQSFARFTIDIDGSVLTTGQKVKGALRGYNPHNRKNPSYYPITATLAQTGHVVAHENRPGNVHDSHGSAAFLRQTVRLVRDKFEHTGIVEVRTDSAFFQREFLKTCDALGVGYAIKVPFWPWLNLRSLIKKAGANAWSNVSLEGKVQGMWLELPIGAWGRSQRVAVFRTHRDNVPVKGQLDLFNPDDGYWEHSAVATNRDVGLPALWKFMCGHSIQEKTNAELKTGLAYGDIPTADLRANVAWQKINVLTHNLQTSFQIDVLPVRKSSTLKRTTSFVVKSVRTLRFEWIAKAARLVNVSGQQRLRMAPNPAVQATYKQMEERLPFAA